jgi:hypothetical protein
MRELGGRDVRVSGGRGALAWVWEGTAREQKGARGALRGVLHKKGVLLQLRLVYNNCSKVRATQ